MSSPESLPLASPDGVRAPAGGGVLVSRTCPVCLKTPLTSHQGVCSGRCRAARSRQRRAKARRERNAEILALLEAAAQRLRGDDP
jgi:predicted nucleic acid-binding Zn ribbon protein